MKKKDSNLVKMQVDIVELFTRLNSLVTYHTNFFITHTLPFTIQSLPLTDYHTIPHFDPIKIYSYGKCCGKRRNCL